MIKKIVFGAVIIVIGLLTTLMLSPSSTRWIANQYLETEHYSIDCLDYSLQSFTNIDISMLCLTSSQFSISAKSVNFDLNNDSLFIDQLFIKLLDSDTQSVAKPFSIPDLTLPSYIPKIEVKTVELSAPQLVQPIVFNLTQPSQNSFSIGSDWKALVTVEEKGIAIALDWTLAPLRQYIPEDLIATIGQHQWDSPIRSNAKLSENSITSNHLFTLDFIQQIQGCSLDLTMGGSAQINADLTSQQATLDLSQLAILVNLQSCQPLQGIPNSMQPGTITVGLPNKILIDQEQVSTAQIDINLVEPLATEITLSDVQFLTSGTLTSKLMASVVKEESARFETSGDITLKDGNPIIDLPNSELRITKINYDDIILENVSSNFSLVYNQYLAVDGTASVKQIITETGSFEKLKSRIKVQGSDIRNIDIELNSQLLEGQSTDFSFAKIQQDLQLQLADLARLTGHGKTQITLVKSASVNITDLTIDHSINADISNNLVSSIHNAKLNKELVMVIKQSQKNVNLTIAPQPITLLNPVVKQLVADVSFFNGDISAQLDLDLHKNTGKGRISFDRLSLLRSDMIITGIAFNAPFELDSAGLQLTTSKLTIDEVYNGAKLTNVNTDITATNSVFLASQITAVLFEGSLNVDQVWLDSRDQTLDIYVKDINLQKILNLQEKAGVNAGGIEITGLISGHLPLTIKDLQPSISNAMLSNTGLGTLKVNGNEAFRALKQQSPEIGKNLALLENFNFDSLESSLNMNTSGQTYLDIALKGKNPDKKQALNFNYTHDQDMFTLFKALRIADDFKEKIEKRLSKVH
jgi:hypothetical protein